jgi:hypothetical protein
VETPQEVLNNPGKLSREEFEIMRNGEGAAVEDSMLVNTWEPNGREGFARAVIEAVDPDAVGIDPLASM